MWALSEQLNLHSTWMSGRLAGLLEFQPKDQMTVNVGELMDLCDEHGVPMEKLAQIIGGLNDE